ncbi:MAG: TIGR02452 family protein [Bacteroidota bacterium]
MNRNQRVASAQDTLNILKQGSYFSPSGVQISLQDSLDQAIAQTELFTPQVLAEMLDTLPTHPQFIPVYEIRNETTFDAVRRLEKEGEVVPFVLNFASAKNPGGGFLNGSQAQEESLARASSLYPCLLKAKDYYETHRSMRGGLYTDHMIYAPQVPIFKEEDGNLMEKPVHATIVTSPAVNAGAVLKNNPEKIDQILPLQKQRMEKLLGLAACKGHEVLILGAWGCGVFKQNPVEIAGLFHHFLEGKFRGFFRRVVFAVYTRDEEKMMRPFQRHFV